MNLTGQHIAVAAVFAFLFAIALIGVLVSASRGRG